MRRGQEEDDNAENDRVVIIVKARKMINLIKMKLNMLIFRDIFSVLGEEEMTMINFIVSRLMK